MKLKAKDCAVGTEYMVDCEDGHKPWRMACTGPTAGGGKGGKPGVGFRDASGGRATLGLEEKVELAPAAPALALAPIVPAPELAPVSASIETGKVEYEAEVIALRAKLDEMERLLDVARNDLENARDEIKRVQEKLVEKEKENEKTREEQTKAESRASKAEEERNSLQENYRTALGALRDARVDERDLELVSCHVDPVRALHRFRGRILSP